MVPSIYISHFGFGVYPFQGKREEVSANSTQTYPAHAFDDTAHGGPLGLGEGLMPAQPFSPIFQTFSLEFSESPCCAPLCQDPRPRAVTAPSLSPSLGQLEPSKKDDHGDIHLEYQVGSTKASPGIPYPSIGGSPLTRPAFVT